jgi:GGDEF domain-containing protein
MVKKAIGLTGLFLILQVLGIWTLPSNAMAISYFFLLTAPLMAMVGCFRIGRRTGASVSWEWMAQEWHRADRAKEPLALLFIDVDYFKRMNDTHGHQRGDECLTAVASALEGALSRASDFVARYGGEEFACILPATDGKGALEVGEKLRAAIEALQIEHMQSGHRVLTVPPRNRKFSRSGHRSQTSLGVGANSDRLSIQSP